MTVLPALTTTRPERADAFLDDMDRLSVRTIALFPTCFDAAARADLYRKLERKEGLRIPHVHLRSDCDGAEMEYLAERFGTEAFNIHPRASKHPFGEIPDRFKTLVFVENVETAPEAEEVAALGGVCPDYAHRENAGLFGRADYCARVDALLRAYPIGCCHVSAIRVGTPNAWAGQWDHHEYAELSDFDYLANYRGFFPKRWVSLELENSLEEQLAAAAYVADLASL